MTKVINDWLTIDEHYKGNVLVAMVRTLNDNLDLNPLELRKLILILEDIERRSVLELEEAKQ